MRAKTGLLLAIACLPLSACAAVEEPPRTAAEPAPSATPVDERHAWTERDGALAITRTQDPRFSLGAFVSGELTLVGGRCFGLSQSSDGPVYVAVWPGGTSVLEGGDGLDIPGIGRIRVGERFRDGGGYLTFPDGARPDFVPEGCEGDGQSVSVNSAPGRATPSNDLEATVTPVTENQVWVERDGLIAVADAEEGGDSLQAGVYGELAIVGGRCFGLSGPDEGQVYTALWPAGTTILDGQRGLEVPGLGELAVGDTFLGGGGYSEISSAFSPEWLPAGCSGDGQIVSIGSVEPVG